MLALTVIPCAGSLNPKSLLCLPPPRCEAPRVGPSSSLIMIGPVIEPLKGSTFVMNPLLWEIALCLLVREISLKSRTCQFEGWRIIGALEHYQQESCVE